MVCVIRIGYGGIIGVNNLREITNRIILLTDNLAVSVGIARYTVESIVGSGDRAVAVVYGQYVAVCVVSVAYSAFGRSEARNSAHRVIEYLPYLTACIGDLLADVQLVVFISFGAVTKNSAPVSKGGENTFFVKNKLYN